MTGRRDPVAEAGRIVREASAVVDWSREPKGSYERAIRAALIARHLEAGSLGWMELLGLAAEHPERIGKDLRRAADEAELRLAARVAERRKAEEADARAAVDAEGRP
jgi:hypothetical protein